MNHIEKTAQVNQRGRPFDFFFDQFLTKCEIGTSQDHQRGRPNEIVVDQFETKCEETTSQENKEETLLMSLSTSSQPSMKKGLHKKIKRGLLISFSTSCK